MLRSIVQALTLHYGPEDDRRERETMPILAELAAIICGATEIARHPRVYGGAGSR